MLFDARIDRDLFGPFRALQSLLDPWERLLGEPGPGRPATALALFVKDGALLLRTPLPGVAPDQIRVEVDGNVLTLSGEWPSETVAASDTKHLERPRGSFTRSLRLPFEVDAARVQARLAQGILEVEIPKVADPAPVKIQVLPEAKRN